MVVLLIFCDFRVVWWWIRKFLGLCYEVRATCIPTLRSKLRMEIQFPSFMLCWKRYVKMQHWTEVLFNSGINVLGKGERAQKSTCMLWECSAALTTSGYLHRPSLLPLTPASEERGARNPYAKRGCALCLSMRRLLLLLTRRMKVLSIYVTETKELASYVIYIFYNKVEKLLNLWSYFIPAAAQQSAEYTAVLLSPYSDLQHTPCYCCHSTQQRTMCNGKGDRGRKWNTTNCSSPYFNWTFVREKSGYVVGTTCIDTHAKINVSRNLAITFKVVQKSWRKIFEPENC